MGLLKDEIIADSFLAEIEDDFFVNVTWGDSTVKAMVSLTSIEESFDSFGGAVQSSKQEFKFRRSDIIAIDPNLDLFGTRIDYEGEIYDIDSVINRPSEAFITVFTTLRN